MKSIVLLLSALFIVSCTYAQEEPVLLKGSLSGSILDLISEKPIPNSSIEIFRRDISYTSSNQPVLHSIQYSTFVDELITDEQGKFQTILILRKESDFFNLKIESEGKETLYKNIVIISNGETLEVILELTPEKPDSQEEKRIEEILQDEMAKKDYEKMLDYENLNRESTEINPEKNLQNNSGSVPQPCFFSSIPENVYVSNLHNGYNGSTSGDGFTGYINFDEYVGGVVQGEIGGITIHLQTKKAQAVAARTYSMNRHLKSLSVNIGQAYHDNISSSSINASLFTSQEIMLYEGDVIDAKYSARCNGDYTQNANEGTWAPYSNCNTTGNYIPYLVSRPCSGHNSCGQTSESPCCNVIISTSGVSGYIYGHGVGMCQRGIEQWGELYNLDYCDILHKYYTNICITNDHCGTGSSVLDCGNAVSLSNGITYFGSASSEVSKVDYYSCNDWTETGPERVHTITPNISGTLTATISNFTGDLDVYILGSCDPTDCLGEVTSSSTTFAEAKAGQTYFIVVDADDGSGSAYELLVECTEQISNDITVSDQEILSELTVEPGATIDVQAYQNYYGNSESLSDVSLFYYLSEDCNFNDEDTYLGESYSTIDAGNLTEMEHSTLAIPVRTIPGIYYILFVGDATNAVSEFDEDNNVVCAQVNIQSTEAIKVYPNPTYGVIHFESYYSTIVKLEIYNNIGQLIVKFDEPENSINIDQLTQGMYFLKFIDLNKTTTMVKVLKR